MKFKAQEVVRGISMFDGQIDGETFKTGTVHVDVKLDPAKGGKGYRTEPMRCASLDVVKAVEHNNFPLKCELELEHQAGKKTAQLVVIAIKPLELAKAA